MLDWLFKKLGTDEREDEVINPKPVSLVKTLKSLNKEISIQASKVHEAKNIYLTSDWVSEYDKNFKMEIKIYSSTTIEIRCRIFNSKSDPRLIYTLKDSSMNTVFDIPSNVMNSISIHDDIILHVQSILGQITAEVSLSKDELSDMISIKRNVRLWYIDADDALASYPKYKDKFKKFKGTGRYEQYNGRFIFKHDKVEFAEILEKFPDVDLVEIFNIQTETYEVYNTSAAQEVFLF